MQKFLKGMKFWWAAGPPLFRRRCFFVSKIERGCPNPSAHFAEGRGADHLHHEFLTFTPLAAATRSSPAPDPLPPLPPRREDRSGNCSSANPQARPPDCA